MIDKDCSKAVKRIIRCYFLKGFVFYMLLSIPYLFVKDSLFLAIEDSASIQQNIVMLLLKRHVDSEDVPPVCLEDLHAEKDLESVLENLYYYPTAWDKPGRILLRSKRLVTGSYVVTFGDGTRAFLNRWYYKYRQENKDDVELKTIHAASPLPNVFELLLACFLVLIFFIIPSKKRIIGSDMRCDPDAVRMDS